MPWTYVHMSSTSEEDSRSHARRAHWTTSWLCMRVPRGIPLQSVTWAPYVCMIVAKASRRNGAEISVEPEGKRRAPGYLRRGGLDENETRRMNGGRAGRSLTHRFTKTLVTQFTNSPILTAALLVKAYCMM